MLLNNHWRNQRGNQKIPRNKWQWKHDDPKPMGRSKSCFKREVYSNTNLPQETRKNSNKQRNHTPKGTGERRRRRKTTTTTTKSPEVSRRKDIIKNRAEIN